MAEPERMSKLMGQKLELKSWKKFQLNEVPPQENFQLSRFDRILCLYERLQADSGRQARMRDHTQLDQNPIEMDVRSKGPDHNGVCLKSFKINDTWLIKYLSKLILMSASPSTSVNVNEVTSDQLLRAWATAKSTCYKL